MTINFRNNDNNFLKQVGLTKIPLEERAEFQKKSNQQRMNSLAKGIAIGAGIGAISFAVMHHKKTPNSGLRALSIGATAALVGDIFISSNDSIKNVRQVSN